MKNMSNKEKTILITIASCREYYLLDTIRSAIYAAKHPERIYFSIFNTVLDKKESHLYNGSKEDVSLLKSSNTLYTEFFSPYVFGIGFSRMNAALMYDKEHDFIFQIDAHTIFDKNWDETLINNYYVAEKYAGDKIVLSNMPHGFTYDINDKNTLYWQENKKIHFNDFDSTIDDVNAFMPSIRTDGIDGNNRLTESMVGIAWVDGGPWNDNKITINDTVFHEGNCVFAAMMFYPFKYLLDFLHYPKDPFSGDQINFSLRLLSRGFRIFHFYKPVFVSLNKPEPGIDSDYQWKDATKSDSFSKYIKEHANKHHKEIFSGKYLGYWGAPDKDQLEKSKKIMGIENYLSE